jgi:hypothetical protein
MPPDSAGCREEQATGVFKVGFQYDSTIPRQIYSCDDVRNDKEGIHDEVNSLCLLLFQFPPKASARYRLW